ncbi:hypothetical protein NUU61_006652 [Penicillium alfredii]|uniref:Uncharacterized protein n=1 Tax=Penicillium alfredii TaxID=1506179 RepID=A0A9W9F1C7_9EURO|nr:uncharacterized protein NUU61_006652 [Penicillium alfredii]KAJ5091782.1 hypothetical protein NUU61_006652 [Penicillium alfredii]
MRPGLGKPGAIPLLALIVFSLLTLVPSLSNIYNLKLADFSYYAGGAQHVPLIKDGLAEDPSHPSPRSASRKAWIVAAPHRPRVNRPSRSLNPGKTTISSLEHNGRLPYIAAETSSVFSRRARAMREYFVQHLDGYQFLASSPSASLAAETSIPSPSTLLNSSAVPTSAAENQPSQMYPSDHDSTSSSNSGEYPGPSSPSSLCKMCQPAGHVVSETWVLMKPFAATLLRLRSEYLESTVLPDYSVSGMPTTFIRSPKLLNSPSDGNCSLDLSYNQTEGAARFIPTLPSHAMAGDQAKDGAAGRHSRELHGSCMAVVIGLVVGIFWF